MSEELWLYEFYVDCGRMGDLEGLFLANPQDVLRLLGKRVHFGEVLGKHSEISVTIKPDMFEVKARDEEFVGRFAELFDSKTISGFNPFDYIEDDVDSEDDFDDS